MTISPDTKILIAYLLVMGILIPNVVAIINSTRKTLKRLYEEDSESDGKEK
jgi:hypothetical protein